MDRLAAAQLRGLRIRDELLSEARGVIVFLLPLTLPLVELTLLLIIEAPVMAIVVEEQRFLSDLPAVEDCDAIMLDDDDNPCCGAGGRPNTMADFCVIMPDLTTAPNAVDEETD